MEVLYIVIGLFIGFIAGFWLRHQFEWIKVREDSVFARVKKPEPEKEMREKPKMPVNRNRYTSLISKN